MVIGYYFNHGDRILFQPWVYFIGSSLLFGLLFRRLGKSWCCINIYVLKQTKIIEYFNFRCLQWDCPSKVLRQSFKNTNKILCFFKIKLKKQHYYSKTQYKSLQRIAIRVACMLLLNSACFLKRNGKNDRSWTIPWRLTNLKYYNNRLELVDVA